MQVDKSYLMLLVTTTIFYETGLTTITIDELDSVLEEIKEYIFTYSSQKLSIHDDLLASREAFENIVEIKEDKLKLMDFNMANQYIHLLKYKYVKDIGTYMQIDQLVGQALTNDSNTRNSIEEIWNNFNQKNESLTNEIRSLIKTSIKEYHLIKKRDQLALSSNVIKEDLRKNYEQKRKKINELLEEPLTRKTLETTSLGDIKLIPLDLENPNIANKKYIYDIAYYLKLASIQEERLKNKDNDIITQDEIVLMSFEEYVVNSIKVIDEIINTGLFDKFKPQLLLDKYSLIASFPFTESYFLDNNYTLFSNFQNRKQSFSDIVDSHKYLGCIQNANTEIQAILNISNEELKDNNRFYACLYNCINIQSTIHLNTKHDLYPEFREEIEKHPNYNNENYTRATELLNTILHDKNIEIKKYEKK